MRTTKQNKEPYSLFNTTTLVTALFILAQGLTSSSNLVEISLTGHECDGSIPVHVQTGALYCYSTTQNLIKDIGLESWGYEVLDSSYSSDGAGQMGIVYAKMIDNIMALILNLDHGSGPVLTPQLQP